MSLSDQPTRPPSPPRKGQRTRAALEAAIVRLINERPVEEIRLADICAPAGLAPGAFYFHFAGKDEALEAVAVTAIEDVFARVLSAPASDDLQSEIAGLLSEFYRAYIEEGPRIRAVFIMIQKRQEVRRAWLAVRARLVDRLARRFAAEWPARPAVASPRVLAHYLTGALERFYDDVFFLPPEAGLPAEAANYEVFVHQQARLWTLAVRSGG